MRSKLSDLIYNLASVLRSFMSEKESWEGRHSEMESRLETQNLQHSQKEFEDQ